MRLIFFSASRAATTEKPDVIHVVVLMYRPNKDRITLGRIRHRPGKIGSQFLNVDDPDVVKLMEMERICHGIFEEND